MPPKLAAITSHPIQYNAPWFRHVAARADVSLRVFYLWDFGVTARVDPGFQQAIRWDIPLLSGYDYRFVANKSRDPGTHRFFGLWNPGIIDELEAYQPDAILMLGYNFATLLYVMLRMPRIPLMLRGDSHRLFRRKSVKEAVRRKLISLVFRRFSAFLYVGSANYEYFRYHGVPERKLFRAPHAVDNDRFVLAYDKARAEAAVWKRELGIPPGNVVILFAGKLETVKRPLDLLRAFIDAQLAGVSLVFVGSGPLEAELKTAAAGHSNIHFAPFQNQSLMPRTYCTGDVVVLPSASETWGLAINEAMCMGRSAIVSDHVGCAQDLIVPHKNGLVFPAGNVGALTDCLREAVSDRERLRTWGERSRKLIERYSYKEAADGLLDALAHLTALRRAH